MSETISELCVRAGITRSKICFFRGKSLCNEAFWHWPIATRCFRQGCCYDHAMILSDWLSIWFLSDLSCYAEVLWMSLGTQSAGLALSVSLCPSLRPGHSVLSSEECSYPELGRRLDVWDVWLHLVRNAGELTDRHRTIWFLNTVF